MREPFNYQKRVLAWASDRKYAAFSLEKRLGKTLVAIRWSQQHGCKRVLVVSPLSVIGAWADELKTEGHWAEISRGAKSHPVFNPNIKTAETKFVVTNYETLRVNNHLQRLGWDCVILDESRVISNPQAEITKTVLKSFARVPFKATLSGCPAPETPLEYFTQHQFLKGSFCGCRSYWDFRSQFFIPDANGWRWDLKLGALAHIIAEVNRDSFVLSRSEAGLKCEHFEQVHQVEFNKLERKIYDTTERDYALFEKETKWKPAVLTWLHRLAGGCHPRMETEHKIRELWQLLLTDFKKEPVVVWCKFTSEIDRLMRSGVMRASRKAAYIDGRVKLKDRINIIRDFQGGKLDTVVAQVGCMKYGVDLSHSSTNIFYSLPQDLDSWLQAKNRIIHPMKKDPCLTVVLNTKDTVDEDITFALRAKKNEVSVFRSFLLQHMRDRQ